MNQPRILSRINQDEFFGRDAEVRDIMRPASAVSDARTLVVMTTPDAGASELLRQAYDQLFRRRGDLVPIHFAFRRSEGTAAETARRFFQTFLQQYVAYRRVNPALCKETLTFHDLLEVALPGDFELITNLIDGFHREQASEKDLIDFCLSLPNRLLAEGRTVYPLIDCTNIGPFREDMVSGQHLLTELSQAELPFVVASLRRQANKLIHGAGDGEWEANATLHVDHLSESSAQALLESLARRYGLELNETTRDLIVQQLNASPLFITEFMRAARATQTSLTTYLACQRLYVDELLGGSIKRHFDRILQTIAPAAQTNRTLLRVLYESAMSETGKASLWAWKKRLGWRHPNSSR